MFIKNNDQYFPLLSRIMFECRKRRPYRDNLQHGIRNISLLSRFYLLLRRMWNICGTYVDDFIR
jgi:hypothetical protein